MALNGKFYYLIKLTNRSAPSASPGIIMTFKTQRVCRRVGRRPRPRRRMPSFPCHR